MSEFAQMRAGVVKCLCLQVSPKTLPSFTYINFTAYIFMDSAILADSHFIGVVKRHRRRARVFISLFFFLNFNTLFSTPYLGGSVCLYLVKHAQASI